MVVFPYFDCPMEDISLHFLLKNILHYSLHFLFPGLVAYGIDRKQWQRTWFLFLTTMLIDLDHFLATPVFDPNRCSIGFHIFHTGYAVAVYALAFVWVKNKTIRMLSLGLLMHMATDYIDCLL